MTIPGDIPTQGGGNSEVFTIRNGKQELTVKADKPLKITVKTDVGDKREATFVLPLGNNWTLKID